MTLIEKLAAARRAAIQEGHNTVTFDFDTLAEISAVILGVEIDEPVKKTAKKPAPAKAVAKPKGDGKTASEVKSLSETGSKMEKDSK